MTHTAQTSKIQWIAHRGNPSEYPENSLPGFQSAIDLGARFIECDIQMSQDGIPMVFHDVDLSRMTGVAGDIYACSSAKLQTYALTWPVPSSDTSAATTISPLSELITLLNRHPQITAFIELKTETIKQLGVERYLAALLPVLQQSSGNFILISFSSRILKALQTCTAYPLGWIIPQWTDDNQQIAHNLQPQWLICNHRRLPNHHQLWQGAWQWALYVIDDAETAANLVKRGFTHLETNHIRAMHHVQL